MDMKMRESFITRDLAEASFLVASGIKLVQIEKEDSVFWFLFDDKLTCQKLSDSFWRKEAMVNAQEFSSAIRMLKDVIFRKKQQL